MTHEEELEARGAEANSIEAPAPEAPAPEASRKGRDPNARGLKNRALFLRELVSEAASRFGDQDGFRLGAAISFYALFSIFPLLLLAITIVGFVVGDGEAARERLLSNIAAPDTPVRDVLDHTLAAMQESEGARGVSTVIAVVTLLFAASGVCVELDEGLNRIWGVRPREGKGLWGVVRLFFVERLTAFVMVGAIGLTLVASLVSSSILTHLASHAAERVSTSLWPALARAADLAVGIALLSFVLVVAFHFVPRSHPPMRLLVGGAVLTTALLTELKEPFAWYLAHLTSYSAYGIAGGVLAIASWIYLSSMILYFGAQLTQIDAEKLAAFEAPGDPPS